MRGEGEGGGGGSKFGLAYLYQQPHMQVNQVAGLLRKRGEGRRTGSPFFREQFDGSYRVRKHILLVGFTTSVVTQTYIDENVEKGYLSLPG